MKNNARPAGVEPATPGSEDRCSIQLSYGRFNDRASHNITRGYTLKISAEAEVLQNLNYLSIASLTGRFKHKR